MRFVYLFVSISTSNFKISSIPKKILSMCSSDANASFIPSLSLTMKGGSQFAVYDPIIVISTQVMLCFFTPVLFVVLPRRVINILLAVDLQSELVYCLAVVKSTQLNIIGRKSFALQLILIHSKVAVTALTFGLT